MNKLKLLAASALIALSLSACGGGGEVAATNDTTNTTAETVISGMASKGPIDGTARIYALNSNGSKGDLLTSADIVSGSYSAKIGKYAGPVIIEVTGSYTDEATGLPASIPAEAPLRAALSNASGAVSAAVTPLTELAVQKAGTLTPSHIDSGNKLVSDIFKVDIINTLPVAPENASGISTNQNQKDYTLALAAISQLSKTRGDSRLSDTLKSVAGGITSSGMSSQVVKSFQTAVSDFLKDTTNNKTGISDLSSSNLVSVGTGTATYKLAITPTSVDKLIDANAIKGIMFEIVIPTGLTVRSNAASGETLSGIVSASKSIAAAQPLIDSKFTSSSSVLAFGLITSTGIGSGDLATITCDILPGWTAPSAEAISIRNIKAVDTNANTLTDVNVTVN